MTAWIKSYQALRDHPKTRKLARTLGIPPAQAIGILHCLWWWCVDYAPDGDLTDYDAEVLADACEWSGDADELIQALVGSSARKGGAGFLENGDGLRVHDWSEYGGAILTAKEADAERKRHARNTPSGGRPADVHRTADVDRQIDRQKDLTAAHVDKPVHNSASRRAKGRGTTRGAANGGKSKSEPQAVRDLAVEAVRRLNGGQP